METQSHTEMVRAPVEICFDTIVDFARYPQWFSGITEANIEQADAASGTWTVAYQLDMTIKTIAYTLAYQAQRPENLTWKFVRGDVNDVEGSYVFRPIDDSMTEATCTQGIDIGFWIPGPIKRTFEKSALGDSVREFKKAAEAAAGSR
jgi:ribosome-associated toxin RatA of RatAB toxin-antitoxin module